MLKLHTRGRSAATSRQKSSASSSVTELPSVGALSAGHGRRG
ncbi:hypothetical protein ACRAWF_31480 [Streptomyces sp. L7]